MRQSEGMSLIVKGKSHDRFGWFAGFRDQRDLAAVSANNPSRNAQPQAAAIDLAASCFAAKKGIEDVLKHFRLDSRARVGDAQFNLAIDFLERETDFAIADVVLHCVIAQIEEQLPQAMPVPLDRGL